MKTDVVLELRLGKRYLNELYPMFVYMLRIDGYLLDIEFATIVDAEEYIKKVYLKENS